jgi:hypothetical protein
MRRHPRDWPCDPGKALKVNGEGSHRRLKAVSSSFTLACGPWKSFENCKHMRFCLMRPGEHAGVEHGRNSGNTWHRPRQTHYNGECLGYSLFSTRQGHDETRTPSTNHRLPLATSKQSSFSSKNSHFAESASSSILDCGQLQTFEKWGLDVQEGRPNQLPNCFCIRCATECAPISASAGM